MSLETRFARPDDQLVAHLVRAAVPGAERWELVESGSANLVALVDDVAVRISRDPLSARESLRTQQLVDHLPALAFAVPRRVGPVVQEHGLVAIPTQRLPGQPHPSGSADAVELRRMLDSVHGVDPEPLKPWLAEPHAYCGGGDWLGRLRADVVPLLPADRRTPALRILDAAEQADCPRPVLNHGDITGSNVLWQDGRITGVLDWDLAARCDPADDVATVAEWHGWDLVDQLAEPDTVARADLVRRTYGMQVVAFTMIHDRPADELERAVARCAARLDAEGL